LVRFNNTDTTELITQLNPKSGAKHGFLVPHQLEEFLLKAWVMAEITTNH
jgi:hypothetical protein